MKQKNISVCMATYNGEKYIYEQVMSILKQIKDTDEIIISDDNSTDRTIDILKNISDDRIKIYVTQEQLGCSLNFENAIKMATNEIIFLADQDDVWLDGKVTEMLKALENCDFVISNAIITDANLSIMYPSMFDKLGVKKGFWTNFIKTRYCGCCMAFNNKVKRTILPFPKNTKYCQHDYWITLVVELLYKTNLLDEKLIYYRRHSSNLSSGGFSEKNTRSLSIKIITRIYSILFLLKRIFAKLVKKDDKK